MKRWIACLLLGAICLSLSGCGTPAASVEPTPKPTAKETVTPAPTAEPKPTASPAPVPTSEPTAAPTPAPEPTPSAEPQFSHSEAEAFFENSLFIGDSIMEGIRQYVVTARKNGPVLSDARFLASVHGISIAGLSGAVPNGAQYSYKGEVRPFLPLVEELAPSRIFLMLGLNDLAHPSETPDLSQVVESYLSLTAQIQEVLPDCEIFLLANTPKIASAWLPDYVGNRSFGNSMIDDFVTLLTARCAEEGIVCIDTHTPLSDETGALPDEFCRDGYIHLNNKGSAAVVDVLYRFAENGG